MNRCPEFNITGPEHLSGLAYFSHLGELGASDIHAQRTRASAALISALEIEKHHCVLEVGCGTGKTLTRLARCVGAASSSAQPRIIAADFSPAMLATTRQRLRWAGLQNAVQTVRSHLAHVPLKDSSLDRVYCESVLCIHDEVTAMTALRNIFRMLKPGGRFVANEAIWRETISDAHLADVYQRCLQHFGTCQGCPQPWRIGDWVAAMHSVGFEVTNQRLSDACARIPMMLARPTLADVMFDKLLPHLRRLKPRVRAVAAHYDALYKLHAGEGATIEDWLFVLKKP
jgi:ubiquinone/menaquinone biosynthesis C-methylase UbiE